MGSTSPLRRAVKAFSRETGPGVFQAAGRIIACPHCGSGTFETGRAQLNTAALSFFDLDWANRTAATLTCTTCSHILWFGEPPRRTDPER